MSETVEDSKMPLMEHLIELRRRLLRSFVALIVMFFVCYYFAADIYQFLVQPLADIVEEQGGSQRLIFTGLHEAFFTYIKVGFFAAFFLCFPIFAVEFWKFVAPGLYKHEKMALAPFLVATPILFFLGGAMAYYLVFPMAWQFFLGFQSVGGDGAMAIELEAKVDQYLSLVMRLILAFGVCFELPVILTLLAKVGMVTSRGLREKRKYAIVIAFVAAAILTPPDVISQIMLAVPTILLYEISILAARLVEGPLPEVSEEDLDDEDEDGDDEEDPEHHPPARRSAADDELGPVKEETDFNT